MVCALAPHAAPAHLHHAASGRVLGSETVHAIVVYSAGTLPFDAESPAELELFERMYRKADPFARNATTVTSPFGHIGVMNVYTDIQPFNRLIYAPSLALAESVMPERVRHLGGNIYVLK